MRNPGTVFLYYWEATIYNDAYTSALFITENDKENYLGFRPLVQSTEKNTPCRSYFTGKLEADYFIMGLRILSRKTLIKKNCVQPFGIGIYLGIIDALKNFELSEEDDKDSIQKKLFDYAENWKVGLELGNMQLSVEESIQLTLACEILAEKMVAHTSKINLIEEIVCLGTPTKCIQINNLNARNMEKYFQNLQQLHHNKKLNWYMNACANIILGLYQAGGISAYIKKFKKPTNHFFQKSIPAPEMVYAMVKHAEAAQQAPEKQGCACSVM